MLNFLNLSQKSKNLFRYNTKAPQNNFRGAFVLLKYLRHHQSTINWDGNSCDITRCITD
jgi:hypothetical protein